MNTEQSIAQGYLRSDGRKGIRNKTLVIFTVDCASHSARQIAAHFQAEGQDVDVIGNHGCFDSPVNLRRILSYATHPNVGAVLAVGHGCEYFQASEIAKFAAQNGREAAAILQQECGGTIRTVEEGIRLVEGMLRKLESVPRVPFYFRDLCVGGECGGSDFTSGLAGNPLVGSFFDLLTDAGGTAMFEEMAEALGLQEYLAGRAVDEEARKDIEATYDKVFDYCRRQGQYSISPGNFTGGLTTIEEKSMGAVAKSGSRPIQGVLKVAQRAPRPGLWLLDTTPDDFESMVCREGADADGMMEFIASGAQIVCLVTGRGHVVGNPIAPTIKITGNTVTYHNMEDDIDVNAGRVLTGELTQAQLIEEFTELVASVCGGALTKAEKLGHREGGVLRSMNQDANRVLRRCET